MERLGDYVKRSVLDYKLNLCCYLASVRVGVLGFAILNTIVCCTILVALAEGGFEPLLQQALGGIMAGEKPLKLVPYCIIAYAADLASSVLLLCAIMREDLKLLRVYLYYAFGVLLLAVTVYSVVFLTLSLGVELLIVTSIGYQIYLILLVRSAMVEIKQSLVKNGYVVNLKKNYGAAGPLREKYSVVIETDGYKPPVTSLVRKVTTDDVVTDIVPKAGREVLLQHLAARNDIEKRSDIQTSSINAATKDALPKEAATEVAKDIVTKDLATKTVITKDVVPKTVVTKDEATIEVNVEAGKEVKKEAKKASRSFFGRKEKVKIEDSKAKIETVEVTKKI